MSDNDKLISLREKSSAILSLLTVVASRPADAVEIHKDVTLCGLLPDFNGKHDKKEVDTFYEFLKSEFLTRDNKFSHINHLDALLRCPGILKFFHEDLGLHEAWILFVDTKNVEQLWLKDRANSVVFPEKDRDINKKRIKALEGRNGDDKTFLDTAKPEKIATIGNGLLKKHLYREWLATFLIEKNKALFNASSISIGSLLNAIPAFKFLGTKAIIKKNQKSIEQENLILLSTPDEYWQAISEERGNNGKQTPANQYPFDAFVLDALFAHEPSSAIANGDQLLFFSFPLDPVDLTESGNSREHGALWSGFLLVSAAEAKLLKNNRVASDSDYAKLIWRIRTLRSALNILGQPCVRKQLEVQIAISLGRKHAQMVDLTREWVDDIIRDLQRIERQTQHLHSIYFAPHTAVFAAAPRLKPLFDNDVETNIGKVKITGFHNSTTETNLNAFKNVIAASFVYILGNEKDADGIWVFLPNAAKNTNKEFLSLKPTI